MKVMGAITDNVVTVAKKAVINRRLHLNNFACEQQPVKAESQLRLPILISFGRGAFYGLIPPNLTKASTNEIVVVLNPCY